MNTTPVASNDLLVRKTLLVAATPERAFDVFTKQMSSWWPLATHHISKVDAKEAVVEPFVGGRWFERGVDGSECSWGKVLAWDPPRRLVLSWDINADWQSDPTLGTEVEVRFTSEDGKTRVDLEHRLLHKFGPRAQEMAAIFESPGGWGGMLEAYAQRAAAS